MAKKKAISSKSKSTNTKPKTKTVVVEAEKVVVEAPIVSNNSKLSVKFKKFSAKVNKKPIVATMVAEFVGTFVLTTAFIEMQSSPIYVAFALVGIALMVGGVSGAHLNPAMSIASWISRKIKGMTAIAYIVAQLLGAGASWLVLSGFANSDSSSYMSSYMFHAASLPDSNKWYLFFAEILGTAILAIGIATSIRLKKNRAASAMAQGFSMLAALYITMSITTVLLTESYTGYTFLNPALAMAAGAFSWNLWAIAIFILAPIIGAIIGFGIQTFLHTQDDTCECDDCQA